MFSAQHTLQVDVVSGAGGPGLWLTKNLAARGFKVVLLEKAAQDGALCAEGFTVPYLLPLLASPHMRCSAARHAIPGVKSASGARPR